MNASSRQALDCATRAAQAAGRLMRRHQASPKKINQQTRNDIKLELDVRTQKLIEGMLLAEFPDSAVLGEEGCAGEPDANSRWVVDPIDGTVNFAYGVPHACVSIAWQTRTGPAAPFSTMAGAVYDPFCDELWTGALGGPARLNGKVIHVSRRRELAEGIIAMGFSKTEKSLNENLPVFNLLVRRVRKIRMMGAAALSLAYVAAGRFDAYIESGVSLWDIAAAGLILECAGGDFWRRPLVETNQFRMLADNGLLRAKLERVARAARA
jgi:myo-inositol-1(or 4)-monophosphatase